MAIIRHRTIAFMFFSQSFLLQEKIDLQKERDNLRHECDRLQCERDALQLERDTLIREKEALQAELNNRNDIIHHLQDHVVSDIFAACQVYVELSEPALYGFVVSLVSR